MSWQLASFVILGAVLLGGFAWYERSRPPSQVVALVAALAALAIAGRIAFAAFPNVKPTTDIVVFAGYALGPAPGFAVGALAGLVSNFWFGQGPWTPWQMVGWGLCGVLGAALALGARNAGRLALAATCGFAGIAYGVLLNFSIMATYGGDLSIQRFLVLETRAIPFDAAHAIGNVAFALLAGPAMVRMLTRFRERFQWRSPAIVTALLVALVLPAAVPAPAKAAGAGSAATWLESVQNADGGFGTSPGSASSAAITGWAMLGLEAAGRNPLDVARGGRTPVDFLRSNLDQLTSAGDLSRTILALEGSGLDPRDFGGRNLVSALEKRRAGNGSYVGWPGSTAYAVIALRAAGATGSLQKSLSWLGNVQNGDGGWGDVPGQPSNADVTGAVMQAMPSSQAAANGLTYLRRHQRSSGGFAGGSGEVNSQSTSWAAQGMIAFGVDPAEVESGGKTALDYLAERQASDGHYSYSANSDQTPIWVTAEVLVAASGDSLPVPPAPRQSEPTSPSASEPPLDTEPTPTPAPVLPPDTVPAPSGGDSGGGSAAPPLVPKGVTPVPEAGGELPGTGVAPPESESPAPQAVASDGAPPPTEAAIGIGLAATALAIGVPWWLGRRNGW
ncbi:MAG TPA: prenyltransferase/squalene oxidase repeat-containing protein [Solirubrobacterales bacterium]|jgi:energy-coupling factor transport system substrate-specific component